MKEFKHLPGLDLIRVFGILVVVFYHYQVETAVRGLCPADFLPAMEPLVQVAVYTMTLLSGSCLCWQEKSRSWSMKRYLWGRFLAIYPLFWLCFFPIFIIWHNTHLHNRIRIIISCIQIYYKHTLCKHILDCTAHCCGQHTL